MVINMDCSCMDLNMASNNMDINMESKSMDSNMEGNSMDINANRKNIPIAPMASLYTHTLPSPYRSPMTLLSHTLKQMAHILETLPLLLWLFVTPVLV